MSVPSFLFFWNYGDTQWKWKDENVHETMIPCIDECKENNSKWNWNETQIDKIETKLFSKVYYKRGWENFRGVVMLLLLLGKRERVMGRRVFSIRALIYTLT
jgi:hypothetical protein